jgi:hypothetical protein
MSHILVSQDEERNEALFRKSVPTTQGLGVPLAEKEMTLGKLLDIKESKKRQS